MFEMLSGSDLRSLYEMIYAVACLRSDMSMTSLYKLMGKTANSSLRHSLQEAEELTNNCLYPLYSDWLR